MAGAVVSYVAFSQIAATVRKPQHKLTRNHFPAARFEGYDAVAEGAMDLGVYTVVKEAKKWTISAGGIRIIACRDRRTAVQTVRRATELLRSDRIAALRPAA